MRHTTAGNILLAFLAVAASGCERGGRAVPESPAAKVPNSVPAIVPISIPVADEKKPPALAVETAMFGNTVSRNMVNTVEKNVPVEWDIKEKTNIKWVVKLGSRAYGGPIVSGGKIFVGTNNETPRNPRDVRANMPVDKGVLMCFDEKTGTFLWQAIHDKLESGRVNDWPREGLCSTPTVEGKYIYYVSNRGELICASVDGYDKDTTKPTHPGYTDKTDAGVVWRLDMIKEFNVYPHNMSSCCPLIVDDLVYVVTGNGVDEGHINLPSPDAPSFLAVNKKTGKVVWRDNSPGRQVMHGQWSNPTYCNVNGRPQIIFPGGDGWLRSFEPKTGELLWRFDCNPKDSKYDLGGRGTRSDFIATPVIYDNKVYIGVGQDPEHNDGVGHLWCIDPTKNNDVSPDLVTDGKVFPPKTKPNPNSAMVWHFGGPAPLAERKKLQRNHYFGRTMSTCAIHEDLLYVTDLSGNFYCLDAKTGKLYWSHDMESTVWGSPYWVDGKIYVGNDDGTVHIFADGKEKKIIAKIEMEIAIRSNVAAVHGILYVMTGTHLYAIEKK